MESPSLDELVPQICQAYETGQMNQLTEWQKNPNNLQTVMTAIMIPDMAAQATHFFLICLEKWTNENFISCELGYIQEMSRTLLLLLYNQIDRFFAYEPLVRVQFGKTYANIVKVGWHMSPAFADFFDDFRNFFDGSLKQRCGGMLLCEAIIETMHQMHAIETEEMKVFKEVTLGRCLDYAVGTLGRACTGCVPDGSSDAEISVTVEYCCSLAETVMSVFRFCDKHATLHQDPDEEDTTKMTIYLPQEWKDKFNFIEWIDNLFTAYRNVPGPVLRCLIKIAAITESCIPAELILEFYGHFVLGMGNIADQGVNFDDQNNIANFVLLATKLISKISHEQSVQLPMFPGFMNLMYDMTGRLMTAEFLSQWPDGFTNLLTFWKQMATKMPNSAVLATHCWSMFVPMFNTITNRIMEVASAFMAANVEEARQVLFDDFSDIHPLMKYVTDISKYNEDEYFPLLDGKFNELLNEWLEDQSNEYTECFMCFCVCILMHALECNDKSEATYGHFGNSVMTMIEKTKEVIESGSRCPPLTERVVLFLIRHLLCRDIDRKICRQENILACLGLCFDRILLTLRTWPEHSPLVMCAVDTLGVFLEKKLVKTEPAFHDLLGGVVTRLLNFSDEGQFVFMDNPSNKAYKIEFYTLLEGLITSGNVPHEAFAPLYQNIQERVAHIEQTGDQQTAFNLMNDLRGLLIGATKGQAMDAYLFLFERLFPGPIEMLYAVVKTCPALYPHFLKFIYAFVDTKSCVTFPKNSAHGHLVFKAAATYLINYFELIMSQTDITGFMNANRSGFRCAMDIMNQILSDKSSNIGALEVYGDPTLVNMFTGFITIMMNENVDIIELTSIPKILEALAKLLVCLSENFIQQVASINPAFMCVALDICCSKAEDTDTKKIVHDCLTAIRYITNFCFAHKGEEVVQHISEAARERGLFEHVLLMLEKMLMKSTYQIITKEPRMDTRGRMDDGRFEVTQLIHDVLQMEPRNWPTVRGRLELYLKNVREESAKNINRLLEVK